MKAHLEEKRGGTGRGAAKQSVFLGIGDGVGTKWGSNRVRGATEHLVANGAHRHHA